MKISSTVSAGFWKSLTSGACGLNKSHSPKSSELLGEFPPPTTFSGRSRSSPPESYSPVFFCSQTRFMESCHYEKAELRFERPELREGCKDFIVFNL